jgi:cold shock CspA family protein
MHKGQLKSWRDDKGFGFIESSKLEQDTFIHISSLKAMSRKPKVGDFIYFEIEKQNDGKNKAINCRIEGVASKVGKNPEPRIHKKSSLPTSKIIIALLVIGVGIFAFQRLGLTPPVTTPAQQTPSQSKVDNSLTDTVNEPEFVCDGRQYCDEMTSREEAKYFNKYCPDTKMDGDKDGFPCENDSRF